MMEVPYLDLKEQHRKLKSEIIPLWEEILDSATFAGGPHVAKFEEEFAKACQVPHAAAVSSGTDALRFIFMALGVRPGDEIITVPFTFIATAEAITQAGGSIVFVDIDPKTYTMNVYDLEKAITKNTKGIVPVHLYGQCADMDAILAVAKKHKLWVVEDACQAHLAEYKGKKAGSIGAAAAFSFYPGKNIGACGEAGAVTTHDAAIAAAVKSLRDHGQSQRYYHDREGYNGRCDALQAAVLRVKLKYLPEWNRKRAEHVALYRSLLSDSEELILPYQREDSVCSNHLFVVQLEKREAVIEILKQKKIPTNIHYPIPLHLQKAYGYLKIKAGTFPVSEICGRRVLSLPLFPEMTAEQIQYVCKCLKEALCEAKSGKIR